MRVGVAGGTFDPVHRGHLAMAEAALACVPLDLVLLVPAAVPPHRGRASASLADRLAMCRLAVEGHPGLDVSDIEARRPGPSYTVDTLRDLARLRPGDALHLVLGWDAARLLASWHDPVQVQRLARLVIVARPGWPAPDPAELREAGIDPAGAIVCDLATPDVEATDVRDRLARGEPVDHLLDPAVAEFVRRHHLYREPG